MALGGFVSAAAGAWVGGSGPAKECNVLPHLGNQRAFFVDKENCRGIRFLYSILL